MIIGLWVGLAILLLIFVPKAKFREAFFIFLVVQIFTWPIGLFVVQKKWIEYPVRFFSYALKSSFSLEYFVYPAICVLFSIYYPFSSKLIYRIGYFLVWTTLLTIAESIIEKNTDLIVYVHWNAFYTWITLFIIFFATNLSYKLYFSIKTSH